MFESKGMSESGKKACCRKNRLGLSEERTDVSYDTFSIRGKMTSGSRSVCLIELQKMRRMEGCGFHWKKAGDDHGF